MELAQPLVFVEFGFCFELARAEVATFLYGVDKGLRGWCVFGKILRSSGSVGVGVGVRF